MSTSFAMEGFRKEDGPTSIRYSQTMCSRYPGGRDDGLNDGWPSTVDLTANGWAPNPLSGPSTNRAEATEARALKMITASAAPGLRSMRQGAEILGQNVQKRLSALINAISGTTSQRRGKGVAYLKNHDGVEVHSDGSLLVLTIKSNTSSCPASPACKDTRHQLQGHFSTLGRQQEPANAEIGSNVVARNPGVAQFYFEHDVDVVSTSQGAVRPKLPKSAASSHYNELDALEEHRTETSNNMQEPWGAFASRLIPDDDISVLELPPPMHRMHEQSGYQNWALDSGFLVPESDLEAGSPRLTGSLILARSVPASPFLESSRDLTNDWRYVDENDSILRATSPPASLMADETDSLMEVPEDLGNVQISQYMSPQNSVVLSYSEFTASECSLPAIYPGMEKYPPSSCAREVNENWSNTSHSLFDTAPQYHHRVVSTPVRLRGGGKDVPRPYSAWRLFLGEMPVGDAEKGQRLLDKPVSTMDNFLLGRRGKPKTGRQLCEETEKRVEKGREIRRRKEEKKRPKEEKKRPKREGKGKSEAKGKEEEGEKDQDGREGGEEKSSTCYCCCTCE